ncbi:hypothetical protein B4N89_24495 [Embleya scabrispora]|uniref:Uncharacterized protein n=1 Tax=Embleya scabrispora TaxID=159449 RepID=A0A1T3P3K2_9ACTN|nr:hypothetical protein [Embleya scabrispora]OPC83679.1 hypothetical protein B4N89_24495 [Embleya scabrispora]
MTPRSDIVVRVSVTESGDSSRPHRIVLPGRPELDLTRAELTALVHEARMRLVRTLPPTGIGRISNSGG